MIKNLILQLLPPICVNSIKKNKYPHNFIYNLQKFPRYKEGTIKLLNNCLAFPDAASVISTFSELFIHESYKFISSKENPLIIDMGANIGLSVIYFKTLYPKSELIAIEADPLIFDYLRRNINSFRLNNIEIINKAVYNSNTNLYFNSDGADGGKISNTQNGNIIIETIDVLDILPKNKEIDFLKMDIEGAELIVLERCKEILENVKKIFIEYHSAADYPQELSKILKLLESKGFRYDIQSINHRKAPFLRPSNYLNGFDLQLEIYAWK